MNSAEWIETNGLTAKGKGELLTYLNGASITMGDMIKAQCYQCMGYYADGKEDCQVMDCPLYPRMPYRKGGIVKRKVVASNTVKNLKVKSVSNT
jgi:hypothetical protein